jgi:hypothetical protein
MTLEIRQNNGYLLTIPESNVDLSVFEELQERGGFAGAAIDLFGEQKSVNDTLYQFLRIIPDELRQGLAEVAKAMPGDQRDILEFASTGDAEEEIKVEHGMGYIPENFEVTFLNAFGTVIASQEADKLFAYFKTNTPEGTKIRVRLY